MAVELHVPMQVVARALDDIEYLLGQMPVLARRLAARQELHVDVEAVFLGIHLLVDDMLDQAVGRTLEGHLARFDDVEPILIFLAEILPTLSPLRHKS